MMNGKLWEGEEYQDIRRREKVYGGEGKANSLRIKVEIEKMTEKHIRMKRENYIRTEGKHTRKKIRKK